MIFHFKNLLPFLPIIFRVVSVYQCIFFKWRASHFCTEPWIVGKRSNTNSLEPHENMTHISLKTISRQLFAWIFCSWSSPESWGSFCRIFLWSSLVALIPCRWRPSVSWNNNGNLIQSLPESNSRRARVNMWGEERGKGFWRVFLGGWLVVWLIYLCLYIWFWQFWGTDFHIFMLSFFPKRFFQIPEKKNDKWWEIHEPKSSQMGGWGHIFFQEFLQMGKLTQTIICVHQHDLEGKWCKMGMVSNYIACPYSDAATSSLNKKTRWFPTNFPFLFFGRGEGVWLAVNFSITSSCFFKTCSHLHIMIPAPFVVQRIGFLWALGMSF